MPALPNDLNLSLKRIFKRNILWMVTVSFLILLGTALILREFYVIDHMSKGQLLATLNLGFLFTIVFNLFYVLVQYRLLYRAFARSQKIYELGMVTAKVSHDLKSPLATIETATQLLKESSHGFDQPCLELLELGIKRAQLVADDVLNQIQNQRPEQHRVLVNDLIRDLTQEIQNCHGDVNVHFTAQDLQCSVIADAGKLQRVFANLLKNSVEAMKASGDLFVQVSQSDFSVRVIIRDTGVGMSCEQIQDFHQGTLTSQGKTGGHGLGLKVVRKTLKDLGAHISVDSVKGKGTQFIIDLMKTEDPLVKIPDSIYYASAALSTIQ